MEREKNVHLVSIRLPESAFVEIEELMDEEDRPRSYVIRELVVRSLSSRRARRRRSAGTPRAPRQE